MFARVFYYIVIQKNSLFCTGQNHNLVIQEREASSTGMALLALRCAPSASPRRKILTTCFSRAPVLLCSRPSCALAARRGGSLTSPLPYLYTAPRRETRQCCSFSGSFGKVGTVWSSTTATTTAAHLIQH